MMSIPTTGNESTPSGGEKTSVKVDSSRPRIDVYLNYWLILRTADEVPTGDLFKVFRLYIASRSAVEVAKDIAATSDTFRQLESTDDWSAKGVFLYRWRVMDAGVSAPLLLWLFTHEHSVGPAVSVQCLRVLESYFLRRIGLSQDYEGLQSTLCKRCHCSFEWRAPGGGCKPADIVSCGPVLRFPGLAERR